jgi:hypothetical protein
MFQSLTIHRPSIVVGDSKSGFAPNFHTVYGLVPFARALNIEFKQEGSFFQSLRLSGREHKNIVFVDWLAEQISHVVQNSVHWGRRYHWTTPSPVTAACLFHSILEAISISRPEWEAMGRWMPRLDIDSAVDTHLDVYREYLRDDPTFDRSNAQAVEKYPPPPMKQEDLVQLFAYAIRRQVQSFSYKLDGSNEFPDISRAFVPSVTASNPVVPTDCFVLEVSGPHGGQWVVDLNANLQSATYSPIARAHVSGWAWRELAKNPNSANAMLREGKILIAGPEYLRGKVVETLQRLAVASVSSNTNPASKEADRASKVVGGLPRE